MALKKKFQGCEKSRNKEQEVYKQVFYGTETEVDNKILELSIGTETSGKGFLTSWKKTQSEIPTIFEIEIEYTTNYNMNFSNSKDSGTVTGSKSAQLTARNISMPLQAHPLYKANWNHYLIGKEKVIPSWWSSAKTTKLSLDVKQKYNWVTSISEIPLEGKWEIVCDPTKAGYQSYDKAFFVVTESEKFSSATKAGNSIKTSINKITSPSEDFGIKTGNWKLDESNCSYDEASKKWIVTNVYTNSPDTWDTDLYN